MKTFALWSLPCLAALSLACGGPSSHATAPPAMTTAQSANVSASKAPENAHQIVILATGCWFGRVWTDALDGAKGPPAERCAQVIERVYGAPDKVRVERLRALEAVEVTEMADKVRVMADDKVDHGRAERLVKLFNAIAAAQRENMMARRAADRTKKDLAGERKSGKLTADEKDATVSLQASTAATDLLHVDVGDLGAEARAVGILCAMDRMELARGLPRHLKVYAVQGVYSTLFGVRPPPVSDDATEALKGGVWLGYLTEVAQAAGHPVPARAKTLVDKDLMAWGGTLEGFSDKLRAERDRLPQSTELGRVVAGAVERLDLEFRASEAAVLGEQRGDAGASH